MIVKRHIFTNLKKNCKTKKVLLTTVLLLELYLVHYNHQLKDANVWRLISVCSFKYYSVCLTAAPNQGKTLLKHDFSQTEMQIILWELWIFCFCLCAPVPPAV